MVNRFIYQKFDFYSKHGILYVTCWSRNVTYILLREERSAMKRRLFLIISFSLLICAAVQNGYTSTWVEDFGEAQLDSWKKEIGHGNNATWQTKDGHLDIWIDPNPLALLQYYNLEFIGFPIKADKLRVKVRVLETVNGTPGILIGQHDDNVGPEDHNLNITRRAYRFCTNFIYGPRAFPSQHPDVRFDINEIEIVFNKGHFELLSEGKQILEFDEPNLPFIDSLGIAVYMRRVPLVHTVLDDFIISGPSIPSNGKLDVQPIGKATVLWGRLKSQ